MLTAVARTIFIYTREKSRRPFGRRGIYISDLNWYINDLTCTAVDNNSNSVVGGVLWARLEIMPWSEGTNGTIL